MMFLYVYWFHYIEIESPWDSFGMHPIDLGLGMKQSTLSCFKSKTCLKQLLMKRENKNE